MKFNQWTLGLAATGVISLAYAAQAEEALHPVMSSLQATTLSGYVDTSAIWKFGPGDTVVGRSFDGTSKQNGFNLNVVKLQLEKPLDESQWSAGYRVGVLFGPDANALASTSTGIATSDFAIKNAYVNLRAPVGNGLEFKLGTWDTIIGYEVFEAGNNPNYSRSWGFGIEPIVHTGALASYKVNDMLSLSAGVAGRGDISQINARSGKNSVLSYLGNITFTAPESAGSLKGSTLYAGIIDSGIDNSSSIHGDTQQDVINYYVGATVPTPLPGLSVGASYDYRANALFNESWESAIGGYLGYQATEKLKLNARVEYANGSPGAFGVSSVATTPVVDQTQFLGTTLTADYALWASAITRLEFRWDKDLKDAQTLGNADNILSVALNVIYKF